MDRVLGDSVAIASSTNSCGTGLRGFTENSVSSSGREDVLRRDFDLRAKNCAPFISAQQTTLYHLSRTTDCLCPVGALKSELFFIWFRGFVRRQQIHGTMGLPPGLQAHAILHPAEDRCETESSGDQALPGSLGTRK